jgi:hypothetical protein
MISDSELSKIDQMMRISPNPTSNDVIVQSSEQLGTISHIQVLNAAGESLWTSQPNQLRATVSMRDWTSGPYYFTVSIQDHQFVRQVVKQ